MQEYRCETFLEGTEPGRGTLRPEAKPSVAVAPPPEFGGPSGVWTPEDLFVAAVESCLMMTFWHLARNHGLKLGKYQSRAVGVLAKDASGLRFTRVEIYPELTVEGGPEAIQAAQELMQRAEGKCLVSRSLAAEVKVFPFVESAAPAEA